LPQSRRLVLGFPHFARKAAARTHGRAGFLDKSTNSACRAGKPPPGIRRKVALSPIICLENVPLYSARLWNQPNFAPKLRHAT
jgi:hypothetical protein